MDSSMGKMCLGKDVIEIFTDRNEGSGDWDSLEYKDTVGSGRKKESEALVFHKLTLKTIVMRVCNLLLFQFIINPEEDEFKPRLIFGRSFLRSANAIVNFGEGIALKPKRKSWKMKALAHNNTMRDLDRTTQRELIDSEDRLIPEILVDDVPRVATQRAPRVQRASMQDLYERMGSMEIRQEVIERMEYRHSYHWDRYQGVFEHTARVYSVSLQDAYNPPSYAQPQYDQYYQQYYPWQPPQQQHDDEEDE
ncbi:hypothetical protein Tco_0565513 [Tanacetum coccineum]